MNEQDLTPWFPVTVNPVHVGEYNASYLRSGRTLRWWDGKGWSTDYRREDSERRKQECRLRPAVMSRIEWRGLAKEPK